MSVAKSIAELLGRPLTAEEALGLANFQGRYDIDDDDPLAIVLALVGANTVLINSMPTLLQQKADETIDLHRRTLMDQSTIIAKELIATLSKNIQHENTSIKIRGTYAIVGAIVGSFLTTLFFWSLHH